MTNGRTIPLKQHNFILKKLEVGLTDIMELLASRNLPPTLLAVSRFAPEGGHVSLKLTDALVG